MNRARSIKAIRSALPSIADGANEEATGPSAPEEATKRGAVAEECARAAGALLLPAVALRGGGRRGLQHLEDLVAAVRLRDERRRQPALVGERRVGAGVEEPLDGGELVVEAAAARRREMERGLAVLVWAVGREAGGEERIDDRDVFGDARGVQRRVAVAVLDVLQDRAPSLLLQQQLDAARVAAERGDVQRALERVVRLVQAQAVERGARYRVALEEEPHDGLVPKPQRAVERLAPLGVLQARRRAELE